MVKFRDEKMQKLCIGLMVLALNWQEQAYFSACTADLGPNIPFLHCCTS